MIELKTLKDIEKEHLIDESHRDGAILSLTEDLKQEAIKWINWFDIHSNPQQIFEKETRPSVELLSIAKDVDNILDITKNHSTEIMRKRQKIRDWIKYFFNITEEDLKLNIIL